MSDLLSLLAAELKRLVAPLTLAAGNDVARAALFGALGWQLDSLTGFPVDTLVTTLGTIATDVETLASAVSAPPQNLADLTALAGKIGQNIDAIRALSKLASDPHLTTPPAVTQALGTLGDDLLEFLVGEYLFRYHPVALHVLEILTLGTPPELGSLTPGITGSGQQPVLRYPTARPTLNLDRLSALLTDPEGTLRTAYLGAGLSTPDDARAATNLIFSRVAPLLAATGASVTVGINQTGGPAGLDPQRALSLQYQSPDSSVSTGVGALLQILAGSEGGPGLSVTPSGVVNATWNFPTWTVDLTASAAIGQFMLLASGATLQHDSAAASLSLSVEFLAAGNAPAAVIGVPAGTSLQIGSATITGQVAASANGQQYGVEVKLSDCVVALASGDGDGFLATVLPAGGLTTSFSLDLGWATNRGIYLGPGTGLSCTIPVNTLVAGAVLIDSLDLALTPGADGSVEVVAAVTGGLTIGPIAVTVSQVGIGVQLSFPSGSGNLGPANLDKFGFKPPDGIGLGVDSSLVTGGGYLFTDPARGQYAGAAELQFEGIGLSAVGLLTTKLPGGRPGFSLVVLISVTFPPIELGFGFALTGVGGLVAVNCTANVTALQSGLAAGSLDAVLFPVDLASNAQRVVAELEQYFPAAPGQFVVGPAVQLIWGEDGIFTASIGVLVEFPNPLRVVLLGRLNVTLPGAIEPITEIELDVLGVVDFTAKTLGLDAVMRNSHVADFPLTGGAALRASWGAQPGFLFAAGGFNPRFTPPANFPRLDPVALSLSTSDNPRLRVSAYLAVSSNTVQVGGQLDFAAHVDLLLGTLGVTATLGVDTLFQLRPFAFFIDLHAMVAVTWNGNPVLSAQLDGTFTGPSPLYLNATATVQYLGTHHVHVELTIPSSDAQPLAAPPPVDAAAALRDALSQPSAWHSDPPPGGQHLVRLVGTPAPGGNVTVHPLGVLTVRQRRLPLGQAIQQMGSGTLASPAEFTITAATVGPVLITGPPTVKDYFARAQFFSLPDSDKLSAPSFELMDAGVSLSSAETQVAGGQVTVTAAFTSIVVSPDGSQPSTQTGKALPDGLLAACAGSAPTRGPGAPTAGYPMGPPQVTLAPLDYVLATGTLTSSDPGQSPQRFATYSQAASQRAAGGAADTQVVFADEVGTRPAVSAGPPLVPAPPVTGIIGPVVPPGRAQPFPPPPPSKPPVPVT